MDLNLAIRRTALGASVMMLFMILIYMFTGVGQESLQFIQSPEIYTQKLLRDPVTLKVVIGLDSAFVLLYSTCFFLLGLRLLQFTELRAIVVACTALIVATGLLDLFENMHFLTMLNMARNAMPVSVAEIAFQVWESLIKFHVSYIGLFLLGLVLPKVTILLRLLALSLVFVQWPVGMLIYTGPEEWTKPLIFVRLIFFLTGLLIVAFTDWRKASD